MPHVSCRSLLALVALSAAAAFAGFTGSAHAARTDAPAAACTSQAYAYAGLFSNKPAQGIAALVTALTTSNLANGHVAGWIGVGGVNSGPKGQADWIQAGVNTQAGLGSQLYAEIAAPGQAIKYLILASDVTAGTAYQIAVQQLIGRPNTWQVLVNGAAATAPVYLPASSNFEPMAMSESWNGGTPTCNGFSYRFDHLQITTNGGWQPLTDVSPVSDRGYTISNRTSGGFTASSV